MFGSPTPEVAATQRGDAATPGEGERKITMFGVPSPTAKPGADERTHRELPDASRLPPESFDMHKTMLGGPSPFSKPPPEAPPEAAIPDLEPADSPKRTVMGMVNPMMAYAETPAAQPQGEAAMKQTMMGMPNPLAANAQAGSAGPAPVAPPAETPAPKEAVVPRYDADKAAQDREAAELYAAAKIAAALAEDERAMSRRRLRNALVGLVLVALAAGVVAVFLVRERAALRAELVGDPSVQRVGSKFAVQARVRTSAEATVQHPGGEAKVNGEAELAFEVDESGMKVGDNAYVLEAVPTEEGEAAQMTVHVMLYYRLHTPPLAPPKPGVPVLAQLEVMQGWAVKVDGAKVTGAGENRFQVAIDPAPALKAAPKKGRVPLPVRMTLEGPSGDKKTFEETLELPLPDAPLSLWSPTHNWVGVEERITLRGRTVAGATLVVEGREERVGVGADGVFQLQVPLALGETALKLSVSAPGRNKASRALALRRLDSKGRRKAIKGLGAKAKAFMRGARRRPPKYAAMLADAAKLEGRKVRLKGKLIDARRGPEGVDELRVATCPKKTTGCPVWVELKGPLFARRDARVTVVGSLAGTHVYKTTSGDTLTVPRVRAEILLP